MKASKHITGRWTALMLFTLCLFLGTSCFRSDGSPRIFTSLLLISLFGQDVPDPEAVYITYHHTGDRQTVHTLDPGVSGTNTVPGGESVHTKRLLAHKDIPYCVDSLTLYSAGYHSMWYYERYCRTGEDTLWFELKPYETIEIHLRSASPLGQVKLMTQLESATRSPGVYRNTHLDEAAFVPGSAMPVDTTIYMRRVAQEPVTLLVQYTEAGDPAPQYRSIPVGTHDDGASDRRLTLSL